jgi:hypothetical protein
VGAALYLLAPMHVCGAPVDSMEVEGASMTLMTAWVRWTIQYVAR